MRSHSDHIYFVLNQPDIGISGNKSALNASLAITIVQAFLAHPRRPTAFTLTGRALRAPKHKHADIAHPSISVPKPASSFRHRLARAMPGSDEATRAFLLSAVLAAAPLLLAQMPKGSCAITQHRPLLADFSYSTVLLIQLAGLIPLFTVWIYNSYSPKSAWKNPLVLDPPLSSIRVSKHLVSSSTVAEAIQSVRFPGRGDIVPDTKVAGLKWLMEAAHTPCSMPVQAVWANSVWSSEP